MDELKQLISNSWVNGCVRGNFLNYTQNELSFPICLSYGEKDEIFDVKVIKSPQNVQIRFKPHALHFENKVEKTPRIVNHVNSRLALGIFKYKNQRKLLFYSYSFDLSYYSPQFSTYFIQLFTRLVQIFLSEINFIQNSTVIDFEYQPRQLSNVSSDNIIPVSPCDNTLIETEINCEDCNIPVSLCECINPLIEADKDIENFKGILEEIEKLPFIQEYFDIDSGFFDPESLIYAYNPGGLLGNRVKTLKISEKFKSKLFSMFEVMEQNFLFFKTFPYDLIQVSESSGFIDDFSLALIFEKPYMFKRRFTNNYKTNYIDEMRIAFEILIMQSNQTRGVREEDFIDVGKLAFPDIESERMIGCGGFGKVFINEYNRKTVAIKVEEVKKSNFSFILNEFSFLKRFTHKCVIQAYGVARHNNKKCLVMSYIKGGSLRKLDEKLVGIVNKLNLMKKVARGLAYVHKFEVIHQDIKPHNILLKSSKRKPVIIDFGLATHISSRKNLIGFSFGYSDPDQIKNTSSGVESDIWSFGMVLYWVLFQKNPFEFLKQKTKADMQVFYQQVKLNLSRPLIPEYFSSKYSLLTELMKDCWKENAKDRPSALEIFRRLTNIIDCVKLSGIKEI